MKTITALAGMIRLGVGVTEAQQPTIGRGTPAGRLRRAFRSAHRDACSGRTGAAHSWRSLHIGAVTHLLDPDITP
jgi:hypothetical protein